MEDNNILKSELLKKQIIMFIYLAAIVIGVGYFIYGKIIGEETIACVMVMVIVWSFGSIASIFDKDSQIRRLLSYLGNGIKESLRQHSLSRTLGCLIGLIVGFFLAILIMGATAPIFLIAYLIGINKIKKQIAENDVNLNRQETGNNQ